MNQQVYAEQLGCNTGEVESGSKLNIVPHNRGVMMF